MVPASIPLRLAKLLLVGILLPAWASGPLKSDIRDPAQERLVRACITGDRQTAEAMIARGARISRLDPFHRTPLMYAARYGHKDLVAWLCSRGAEPNTDRSLPPRVTTGNPWPYLDVEGGTALMECAMQGDTGIARILIRNGADIRARSPLGNTALFYAAQSGHVDMVRFLIASSAGVDSINKFGESALSYAVRARQAEVVDLFLAATVR